MVKLLLLLFTTVCLAKDADQGSRKVANDPKTEQQQKFDRLKTIQDTIRRLERDIKANTQTFSKTEVESVKKNLELEITQKRLDLDRARASFISVAADVDIADIGHIEVEQRKDLSKELRELLDPIISAFRRVSARPRRIERYKNEIEYLTDKIDTIEKARKNINTIATKVSGRILGEIRVSQKKLADQEQSLRYRKEEVERKLEKELGEEKSFFYSSADIVKRFFRTKGKNLLLAITTLFSFLWILMYIRRKILGSRYFIKRFDMIRKPINAAYSTLAVTVSLASALICLYALNDWVLVTISILIISAALWSMKQVIPQFLREVRLILNFGTVREGQRIIWNDIPWVVHKLGVYCVLVNKSLQEGRLTVNAGDLVSKHSRPLVKDEPWFPTKTGDWVEVESDFGQVIMQSPEQMMIKLINGHTKFFPTAEFIKMKPINCSHGFGVTVEFGLDYALQSTICSDVLTTVKAELEQYFKEIYTETDDIEKLTVEFDQAAASSLNLFIRLICNGRLAEHRPKIKRQINTAMVEICNRHQYTIPFTQLTLHVPEEVSISQ